jgi:hypothetical protein
MASLSVNQIGITTTSNDTFNLIQKTTLSPEEGNLCGRIVKAIEAFFCELGKGLVEGARKTAIFAGQLFRDCTSLARVCRLGINAFSVIEKCIGQPGLFTAINNQLGAAEGLIYTVSVGDQIKFFGTGKQKEESILNSLGQGALLAAGIGGVFVLLSQVALLSYTKISEAMGSIPVIGSFMKDISLGQIVSGIAAAGFIALACDNASKIANADTKETRVQAIIDLAWNISELALAVFVTVSAVSLVGLLVLGTVAAGLGITSFIYSKYVEGKAQEAKDQFKLIVK